MKRRESRRLARAALQANFAVLFLAGHSDI